MIELPEALHLADQFNEHVAGQTIARILTPTKLHKFCWYSGDPGDYDAIARGVKVVSAKGFGIFCELLLEQGWRLCFNDGVNVRLQNDGVLPKDYQLAIELSDGRMLVFTVAMYGGVILHDGSYDNSYYLASRRAISPLLSEFSAVYWQRLADCKDSLSAKAFLATEQRFPGIGNGVLQDILLAAGVHPKRKLASMNEAEREKLLEKTVSTLGKMIAQGGRDTEKDLFGLPGGYAVRMSKNALITGCPICGGPVVKEAYLGGSVYYCPVCQPL